MDQWKLDNIKSDAARIRKMLEGALFLGEPIDFENQDMVLAAGFYAGLYGEKDRLVKEFPDIFGIMRNE